MQDGQVGYHVGTWSVPKKPGVPFVGTERDGDPNSHITVRGQVVGHTCMTDFEIKDKG